MKLKKLTSGTKTRRLDVVHNECVGVVEPGPGLRHSPFYVVCEPSHLKCKNEGKPTI